MVNYREPLIQITRLKDGTFAFDYSRFDRWSELFFGLGFRYLSGHHILVLNSGAAYGGIYVIDEATGKKQPLLKDAKDCEEWLAFLAVGQISMSNYSMKTTQNTMPSE